MSGSSPSPAVQALLGNRVWAVTNSAWMLSPILLLGLGTGVSFVYIGKKAGRAKWQTIGWAYVVGLVISFAIPGSTLLLWVGGIVHATLVNREWLQFRAEQEVARKGSAGAALAQSPVQGRGTPTASAQPPVLDDLGVNPAQFFAPGPPPGSPPAAAPAGPPAPSAVSHAAPVDLNTASRDEIAALPGMTTERCDSVIAARRQRGRLRNLDDLVGVAGLKPHELVRIRDRVTFSVPPSAPQAGRVLDI